MEWLQKKVWKDEKKNCYDDKKGFFLDLIMIIINWFENYQIVFVYFFGFLKKAGF